MEWQLPTNGKVRAKPANLNLRTKKLLTAFGYVVETTQYYNYYSNTNHDLFTFGDLLAFNPNSNETIIVQACGSGDKNKRVRKILACNIARQWLQAEPVRQIWVVHWRRRTKDGVRVGNWIHNTIKISLKDFYAVETS